MAGESVTDRERLHQLLVAQAEDSGAVLALKRGERGLRIYVGRAIIDVPGFPVEIVNTVGAGDGFASGLIYGWAQGWDWNQAARFANACGALVVTRHGCARALPYRHEVEAFIKERGKSAT